MFVVFRVVYLGQEEEKDDGGTRELPLIYKMEFVDDASATIFGLPEGVDGDETFWSEDPWYWTHYLEFQIVSLSKISGISIEALRTRCAEIMRKKGWSQLFLDHLRELYNSNA